MVPDSRGPGAWRPAQEHSEGHRKRARQEVPLQTLGQFRGQRCSPDAANGHGGSGGPEGGRGRGVCVCMLVYTPGFSPVRAVVPSIAV